MFHKGLTKNQIIETTKDLIEKNGYNDFSMHQLASILEVKTASLYSHIESMETLLRDVGLLVLEEQKEYQMKAINGKTRDDALRSLTTAYYNYAKEHIELYYFIMKMQIGNDTTLKEAAAMITIPVMQVLNSYNLTNEDKMHLQRVLRALMHGFISQEANGYFCHYPINIKDSYNFAIEYLIESIKKKEDDYNG